MATYMSNQFRPGLKLLLDGMPFNILETEAVHPGRGQAFTRIKIRNLKTWKVIERTFKSGEIVEAADIEEREMQYLYNDGVVWHFMDPANYEQHEISTAAVGEAKTWIKEQDLCMVLLWNGEAISVEPPKFVVLQITETDPGVRGDTSGGGGKPATLETGAVVRVPLFVQIGEMIKVDTRTGEYVSRAK